jgi:hypothetical protein
MRVLIIADTFAPSIDGPAYLSTNTIADCEVDSAVALVHAGKALYVNDKDDKSKLKMRTATPEQVADAVEAAKAAKAAEKLAKA